MLDEFNCLSWSEVQQDKAAHWHRAQQEIGQRNAFRVGIVLSQIPKIQDMGFRLLRGLLAYQACMVLRLWNGVLGLIAAAAGGYHP
jgi:hypothetical protein